MTNDSTGLGLRIGVVLGGDEDDSGLVGSLGINIQVLLNPKP